MNTTIFKCAYQISITFQSSIHPRERDLIYLKKAPSSRFTKIRNAMEKIHELWAPPIWAPDTLNYRIFFNAAVLGDIQAIQKALANGEININTCPDYKG